jgi:hypothetical protein
MTLASMFVAYRTFLLPPVEALYETTTRIPPEHEVACSYAPWLKMKRGNQSSELGCPRA